MRIWIINNTKFGYKNNNADWFTQMLRYFDESFISYLQKMVKPDDTLIHLGNLFDNSDHINTLILNGVQDLFERISNIIPVKLLVGANDLHSRSRSNKINAMNIFKHFDKIKIISEPIIKNNILLLPWTKTPINDLLDAPEIVFMNSDYLNYNSDLVIEKLKNKKVFCGFYNDYLVDDSVVRIGAPYQLEKTSENKGFCVFDFNKNKHIFVENKFSPRFKTITITNEEQLDDLDAEDIKYNYVNIIIDKSLVGSKKIKMDVLLSKYDFKNITYINNETVVEEFTNETDIDIINICREHLKDSKPSVIEEFEKIVKLKQERY